MASQKSIEADLARRGAHASMYEKPPYKVSCPECGSDAGKPCRGRDRRIRPAHPRRHEAS